jgi:hypothetical protein
MGKYLAQMGGLSQCRRKRGGVQLLLCGGGNLLGNDLLRSDTNLVKTS